MKIEDIKSEEDVNTYIEGCLNDFENGVIDKPDASLLLTKLIISLVKRDRFNQLKLKTIE